MVKLSNRGSTDRRQLLATLGAASAVSIAGCLGSSDGSDGSEAAEQEIEVTEEGERSRAEIADHLESVATALREQEKLEIDVDGETVPVFPTDWPTYQIQIEDELVDGEVEREVGFTLMYPRTDEEESLSDEESLT